MGPVAVGGARDPPARFTPIFKICLQEIYHYRNMLTFFGIACYERRTFQNILWIRDARIEIATS